SPGPLEPQIPQLRPYRGGDCRSAAGAAGGEQLLLRQAGGEAQHRGCPAPGRGGRYPPRQPAAVCNGVSGPAAGLYPPPRSLSGVLDRPCRFHAWFYLSITRRYPPCQPIPTAAISGPAAASWTSPPTYILWGCRPRWPRPP